MMSIADEKPLVIDNWYSQEPSSEDNYGECDSNPFGDAAESVAAIGHGVACWHGVPHSGQMPEVLPVRS